MNPNPEKSQNAQNEEKILQFWRDNNIFAKTLENPPAGGSAGEYNFFEGPPTANGRPGIHHVLARSFKDIIPRYKTMRGFHVRRKAGWDTHGLPVELQVEKALGLKSKKEVQEYGIAAFNQKCKESVWTYKDEWEQLTERMGYWIDMNDPYVTYDNNYIEGLWSTVKKIDERGYLYRDFRVGPWCSRCETQLASHELNQPGAYKDVKDLTAFVKFKIKPGQKICDEFGDCDSLDTNNIYILAWTTTPWTLPGNTALAVGSDIDYRIFSYQGDHIDPNSKEEVYIFANSLSEQIISEITKDKGLFPRTRFNFTTKGSDLVGLQYEPLYPFMSTFVNDEQKKSASWRIENAFKVYAADFVTTTDGTGIVHIAPMYGADDFDLATKYNLPKFHVVNESGKYIDGCDTETLKLSGRYVKEKDENGKPTLAVEIIDDLTARSLLLKKENYAHSYPHCWRCDTPLLYYARTSWYFRVSQLRDQLVAANQTINWEPDHIRDGRFGEWLEGIKDWAISRDRYWGTPLPVWQNTDGTKRVVIGGLDDIKKYSKKSGNKYFVARHGQAHSNINNVWDSAGDPENHLTELGQQQAKESGEKLKDTKIDIIISSPILRTRETARIMAEQIGYNPDNIIIDERVIEWQVGSEFQGKDLQGFLDLRNAAPNRYEYKSADGESYRDVIKRSGDFLYDIESKYQGKNILIVCHNSSARSLFLVAEGFMYDSLLK
jgi:isoleucyl-tRNA synthetase